MKTFNKVLLAFQIITLMVTSLNEVYAAIATVSQGTPTVNCSDFCSQFVNTPTQQSSNSWNTADDQMCFMAGSPTSDDPSVNVMPSSIPSVLPEGLVNRCKYHNSQAEQYCLAYLSIEGNTSDKSVSGVENQDIKQKNDSKYGSKDVNIALLSLDYATLAACTTACFSDPASMAVLNGVCAAASITTGIFEMTQSAMLASNNTTAAVNSAIAGIATMGGAAAAQNSYAAYKSTQGLKSATAGEKASNNKAACGTAVMMAVVAGIRTSNIVKMNQTSSDVCSNIQSLVSSSFGSATPAAGTTQQNNQVTNSSGRVASAGGTNGVSAARIDGVLNHMSQNPSQNTSAATAAEGSILSHIPETQAAFPSEQLSDMLNRAMATGSGSALGEMEGVPAGFTNALSNISNSAQKDADILSAALGMNLGPVTSSLYAQGSAPSTPVEQKNPFANFKTFSPTAKTTTITFAGENTKNMSLFQVASRVYVKQANLGNVGISEPVSVSADQMKALLQ